MLWNRLIGATNELAYVGGYTESFVGTTSNKIITLTSLTGGLSTAPEEGDVVIFAFSIGAAFASPISYKINTFTEIANLFANDAGDTILQVGYKVMSVSPDTTVTLTGGTSNTLFGGSVAIQVWRGVNETPLDVTPTTATQINTVIPNPPAITPVTANSQIIVIAGGVHFAGDSQTYAASYLDNFITSSSNDTYDSIIGMGNVEWISGTYDPASFTFSGTDSADYSNASVTIALRSS
jgi:hypothetical protein